MLRDRQPVILAAIKGSDSASSLGFWVLYLGAEITKLHNTIRTTAHTHSVLSASESLSMEDVEGVGEIFLFLRVPGLSLSND